jgi:hypothetical protein
MVPDSQGEEDSGGSVSSRFGHRSSEIEGDQLACPEQLGSGAVTAKSDLTELPRTESGRTAAEENASGCAAQRGPGPIGHGKRRTAGP